MSVRGITAGIGRVGRYAIAGAMAMAGSVASAVPGGAVAPERQTISVSCDFTAGDACDFVATGVVSGSGFDVPTGDDRQAGRTFHAIERFVFTSGSFAGEELLLRLNGVNKDEQFDPTTCEGSFAGAGTWKVVGGTGPLADAKGQGTFSFEGGFQAVPGPSGDCLDDGATGGVALEFTGAVALPGEG